MEGTQEGETSYLSGDVPVECMRLMPVGLTATRGPRTVCTGAQRELARVEPLGPPQSQEGSQPHSPSRNQIQFTCPLCSREKTYQGIAASVAAHQREAHPGEGNSFFEKLERLLLLLFLTFSALVANPKKTTLHGGQSRSWSAEQGKKEKEKVWQRTPPPPPRALLVRRKNKK